MSRLSLGSRSAVWPSRGLRFVRSFRRLRPAITGVAGAAGAGALVAVLGCHPERPVSPPTAEFLVATPDSTFWVQSGATGLRVRGVPMTITRYDGRFHEVYVADLDRSFDDAIFTGERLYVRDLQTGDSALVYDDTAVVRLAAQHARLRPAARPLGPEEESPDDPEVMATGETDVLGVRGPFVLLEHRFSFSHADADADDTTRVALDLRTGHPVTPAEVTRNPAMDDSALVRTLPTSWHRRGYTLLARGDGAGADGPVSLSLRDEAGRLWPALTVGERPRVYWLDAPGVDGATRNALARAFNEAAAYDESVRSVADRRAPVPAWRRRS